MDDLTGIELFNLISMSMGYGDYNSYFNRRKGNAGIGLNYEREKQYIEIVTGKHQIDI